jgi:hypothetical protein
LCPPWARHLSEEARRRYSSLFELEERPLEPERLPEPPPDRLLRAERVPDVEAGALRVGSSPPSREGDEVERVDRVRLEGGGFDPEVDASFERRRERRSSGGAARRTGVSQ